MRTKVEIIAEVLCKSGKFETGEGTCALLCMDHLGDVRRDCSHRNAVHGRLAENIDAAIASVLEDDGWERKRAIAAIHWVFNADGTVGERSMAQEAIHKINDPTFMPSPPKAGE